jgi:hypothetical protein
MDKEKRKKIIWLAIIILVIIGIFFIIWRLSNRQPDYVPGVDDQPVFAPPSSDLEYNPLIVPSQTTTEFSVVSLSKSFAERFGSWSTDNPGHNLIELSSLSTQSMQNYLNNLEANYDDDFTGITTKSISAEILTMTDSQAAVIVNTQRVATDENFEQNIYYQDIEVSLSKINDIWLVNSAYWQ